MIKTSVDEFLDTLIQYDNGNMHPTVVKIIDFYSEDVQFNPNYIAQISVAASGKRISQK